MRTEELLWVPSQLCWGPSGSALWGSSALGLGAKTLSSTCPLALRP